MWRRRDMPKFRVRIVDPEEEDSAAAVFHHGSGAPSTSCVVEVTAPDALSVRAIVRERWPRHEIMGKPELMEK
jgi:hypothetical protein